MQQFKKDVNYLSRQFFIDSTDAIVITKTYPIDHENAPEILYVNRAFEEMTGYSKEEVINKSPRILQVDERDREAREKIKQTLTAWSQGQEVSGVRVELCNKRKDNTEFWVELNIFPIWNKDYSFSYWASIQRLIDEKIVLQRKLTQQTQEAENRVIAYQNLMANLSHELRTPLNAIIGFTDMINNKVFGDIDHPRYKEYINIINESGKELKLLIDNIMDLYILECNISLERSPTSIHHLFKKVIEQCTINNENYRGQLITIKGDDIILNIDHNKFKKVFQNILGNALKFTNKNGNIVFLISRTTENNICIELVDNGIGINSNVKNKIFHPFGQNKEFIRKKGQGTGLGLAICKKIIENHGGTIAINSEASETVLSIILPAKLAYELA